MNQQINIGLFGFGCVGQGLYDVLSESRGFKADIKKIVIKDPSKPRSLSPSFFTTDANEVLQDPEINLIVELIDNSEEAYHIVTAALRSGKNVVTANKKLIAEHFAELVALQEAFGASLLYEASSCGSIPVIRTLEEYYDNELLHSVSGIFNGSSNYILSKVANEGLSYASALKQAQELGFAESDPTLDVGGFDAKYKLTIITGHSYGLLISPDNIFNYGIENLRQEDLEYAQKSGAKIKLVAHTGKVDERHITASVLPQLVKEDHPLYNVENEYNAVTVEAAFSDKQLFIGKGAGGHPTGSAVLSDISANSYGYRYEYKKRSQAARYKFTNEVAVEVYLRYHSDDLLSHVPFLSIEEEAPGYVVGTIKISELIRAKSWLQRDKAFLASTGKFSFFEKPSVQTAFREVALV